MIAVEVHQAADDGQAGDMIFDAELLANRADKSEAPSVRIAHPGCAGARGPRDAAARGCRRSGRSVRKLTLFVDDREVGSVDGGRGAFDWTPDIGPQRVRVVAEDDAGATTAEDRVSSASKTCRRSSGWRRARGHAGTMVLSAEASDDDGQIKRS